MCENEISMHAIAIIHSSKSRDRIIDTLTLLRNIIVLSVNQEIVCVCECVARGSKVSPSYKPFDEH